MLENISLQERSMSTTYEVTAKEIKGVKQSDHDGESLKLEVFKRKPVLQEDSDEGDTPREAL